MFDEKKIYLSKRNLQVLLSKVERFEAGQETNCAIIKYNNHLDPYNMTINEDCVMIVAVPDKQYYVNREAGVMHPLDTPKEE